MTLDFAYLVRRKHVDFWGKIVAVAMVAVLLFAGIVVLNSSDSADADSDAIGVTVVYHPYYNTAPSINTSYNYNSASDFTKTYCGTVFSTEYNPQVWDTSNNGASGKWYEPKNYSYSTSSNKYVFKTYVFTGWAYKLSDGSVSTSTTYYPGEVIEYKESGSSSGWYVRETSTKLYQDSDGKIHIYATWALMNAYSLDTGNWYVSGASKTSSSTPSSGSVYTNIRLISSGSSISLSTAYANKATIRANYGVDASRASVICNNVGLGNACIIDNVWLKGYATAYYHGDASNCNAIYAQGNTLVLGDGLYSKYYSTGLGFPQIVGGYSASTAVSSTCLIFHSGTYGDIVGGSSGGSTISGSTNIIVKGATLLDTMVGASVNGTAGSTHLYLTGLKSVAAPYYENLMNRGHADDAGTAYVNNESAVVCGGSTSGKVSGSTYVYVSGNSDVWMVQPAGRSVQSNGVGGDVHVEVSGDAVVRRAVCGTVTDGNSGGDARAVGGNVYVTVRDHAMVASVVGAGFDMWAASSYASYYGGTINVNILGGTVGYVYGGAMRSQLGTSSSPVTINVNISGGKVLNDVYGGGSGTVTNLVFDTNTANASRSGPSVKDSTGMAYVYGSVNVTMTGGEVCGSIYGGGKSVAALKSYGGMTYISSSSTYSFNSASACTANVAMVSGSTNVKITGGTVGGSVYGAGKGIETDSSGKVTTDYSLIYTVLGAGSSKAFGTMTWLTQGTGSVAVFYTQSEMSNKYLNYAKVSGTTTVSVSGDVTIGGSVYGGGELGLIESGSTSIAISSGTIDGSVFGAGKGTLVNVNGGKVTGSTSITLSGNMTVGGSVYGGGELGLVDSGNTSITMTGGSVGGSVYGAGKGNIANVASGKVTGSTTVSLSGNMSVGGSVYGGGELGSVESGTTSVTISGGTIDGSVFGAGKGDLSNENAGKVSSSTTVSLSGNVTVGGSVYGGGELGSIGSGDTSIIISGGIVNGSVYGAGKGNLASESVAKVTGNATVRIIGTAIVNDSVFGGGELGILYGGTDVGVGVPTDTNGDGIVDLIDGGVVNGSVYGGGLGSAGRIAVTGSKNVTVNNGTVGISVYGGSSYGDDGVSGQIDASHAHATDTVVVVGPTSNAYSTLIGGSIFGSGFKGYSTADTYLYIGYSTVGTPCESDSVISIGQSIYGGGDVGKVSASEAFQTTNVYGDTTISINAVQLEFQFSGSILGSGNSCLVSGASSITVDGLVLDGDMLAIQRAQSVLLNTCTISLSGLANGTADRTRYSFYGINNLVLKAGTSLWLHAAISEIAEYHSMSASGSNTISSSPVNKVYACDGTVVSFYTTSGSTTTYSPVFGYTVLSLVSPDSPYGAFAYGHNELSPGGFVIESNGNYKIADHTDFADSHCRCWHISGTSNVQANAVLKYDSSSGSTVVSYTESVSLPLFGSGATKVRFSGALFHSYAKDTYKLVTSETITSPNNYSICLGNSTEGGRISFGTSGSGHFVEDSLDSGYEISNQYVSTRPGLIQFTVYGYMVNDSRDVGYVLVYLQEVKEVQFRNIDGSVITDWVAVSSVELKIIIGNLSDGSDPSDADMYLETISGAGSASYIISPGFSDAIVTYVSSTKNDDDRIAVGAVYNSGSTLGWKSTSSQKITDLKSGQQLGVLTGAYQATLQLSVYDGWDEECSFYITFGFTKSDGTYSSFKVHVFITPHPPVTVSFVDSMLGRTTNVPYDYGSVISESSTPYTGENFIGWYYDGQTFLNEYRYVTPVTSDLVLYARYMYSITFDCCNGSSSVTYITMAAAGSLVPQPDTPTYAGYDFQYWYIIVDGKERVWDFDHDAVDSSVTIYAKWSGKRMYVQFEIITNIPSKETGYIVDGTAFIQVDGDQYRYYDGSDFSTANIVVASDGYVIGFESSSAIYLNSYEVTYGSTYSAGSTDMIQEATSAFNLLLRGLGVKESDVDANSIRWLVDGVIVTSSSTVKAEIPVDARHIVLSAEVPAKNLEVILLANSPGGTVDTPSDFFVEPEEGTGNYVFTPSGASSQIGKVLTWWTTSADGTGAKYHSGLTWTLDSAGCIDGNCYITVENGVKTLRLYAQWEDIPYDVTIASVTGGVITAHLDDVAKSKYDDVKYGQRIFLSFQAEDGYSINNWIVYGEGTIVCPDPGDISQAYIDIVGTCTISAKVLGLESVEFDVYVDLGATPSASGDVVLCLYTSTGSLYRQYSVSTAASSGDLTWRVFSGQSKVGDFYLYAKSNGVLYQVWHEVEGSLVPYVVKVKATESLEESGGFTGRVDLFTVSSSLVFVGPDIDGETRVSGIPKVASVLPEGQLYEVTIGEHYEVTSPITIGSTVVVPVGGHSGTFSVTEPVNVTGTVETPKVTVTYQVHGISYNYFYESTSTYESTVRTGKFSFVSGVSEGSEVTEIAVQIYYGQSLAYTWEGETVSIPSLYSRDTRNDGKTPEPSGNYSILLGINDDFVSNRDWMVTGWYSGYDSSTSKYTGEIDTASYRVTGDTVLHVMPSYYKFVGYHLVICSQSTDDHSTEIVNDTISYYRLPVPHDAVDDPDNCPILSPQFRFDVPVGYNYDSSRTTAIYDPNVVIPGELSTGSWIVTVHLSLIVASPCSIDLGDFIGTDDEKNALVEGWSLASAGGSILVPDSNVYYGDYVTLPALSLTGHKFAGWIVDDSGSTRSPGVTRVTHQESDGSFTYSAVAVFALQEQTITFDVVHGSIPANVYKAYYGTSVTSQDTTMFDAGTSFTNLVQGIYDYLNNQTISGYTLRPISEWTFTYLGEEHSSMPGTMPADDIQVTLAWDVVKMSMEYSSADSHSSISLSVNGSPRGSSATKDIVWYSSMLVHINVDQGYELTKTTEDALKAIATNYPQGKFSSTEVVDGDSVTKRYTLEFNSTGDDVNISVSTQIINYYVTIVSNNTQWGTVDKSSVIVPYGTVITVDPSDPKVVHIGDNTVTATCTPSTPDVTYSFGSWSVSNNTKVVGNMTVTAGFITTAIDHIVKYGEGISAYYLVGDLKKPITSGQSVPYKSVVHFSVSSGYVGIISKVGSSYNILPYTPSVSGGEYLYTVTDLLSEAIAITADEYEYEGVKWYVNTAYKYLVIKSDVPGTQIPDFDDPVDSPWYIYYGSLRFLSIRENISQVGDHAFDGCVMLEMVDLSSDIERIGDYAFRGSSALKYITLPKGVTLGLCAFTDCTSVTTITATTVSSMGDYVFQGCSSLTTVTIEPMSFPEYCFSGCSSLEKITIKGTFQASIVADMAFYGTCEFSLADNNRVYKVKDGVVEGISTLTSDMPDASGGLGGDTTGGQDSGISDPETGGLDPSESAEGLDDEADDGNGGSDGDSYETPWDGPSIGPGPEDTPTVPSDVDPPSAGEDTPSANEGSEDVSSGESNGDSSQPVVLPAAACDSSAATISTPQVAAIALVGVLAALGSAALVFRRH